jgi:hypothetical protein
MVKAIYDFMELLLVLLGLTRQNMFSEVRIGFEVLRLLILGLK